MTDEQHPSDSKMQGKHVDKINVDGQILSADEILARARQRIQAKKQPDNSSAARQPQSKRPQPQVQTQRAAEQLAAMQAQNDQARQNIRKKKPQLQSSQAADPFASDIKTVVTPKKAPTPQPDATKSAQDQAQATLIKAQLGCQQGILFLVFLARFILCPGWRC